MRGIKTPWGICEGYAMINEFELLSAYIWATNQVIDNITTTKKFPGQLKFDIELS